MGILRNKEKFYEPIRIEDITDDVGEDYANYILESDFSDDNDQADKEGIKSFPCKKTRRYRSRKCVEMVDGLAPKRNMSGHKWRRIENARMIMNYADLDDIYFDGSDLIDETITAFTRLLRDESKMKLWNDFIEMDEKGQEKMIEKIEKELSQTKASEKPCSSKKATNGHKQNSINLAEECFKRLDRKIRNCLLNRRSIRFDYLSQIETDLRAFFEHCSTGVFCEQIACRIKRFYMHAVSQFLRLKSQTLNDADSKNVVQVENDKNEFSPPEVFLMAILKRKRQKGRKGSDDWIEDDEVQYSDWTIVQNMDLAEAISGDEEGEEVQKSIDHDEGEEEAEKSIGSGGEELQKSAGEDELTKSGDEDDNEEPIETISENEEENEGEPQDEIDEILQKDTEGESRQEGDDEENLGQSVGEDDEGQQKEGESNEENENNEEVQNEVSGELLGQTIDGNEDELQQEENGEDSREPSRQSIEGNEEELQQFETAEESQKSVHSENEGEQPKEGEEDEEHQKEDDDNEEEHPKVGEEDEEHQKDGDDEELQNEDEEGSVSGDEQKDGDVTTLMQNIFGDDMSDDDDEKANDGGQGSSRAKGFGSDDEPKLLRVEQDEEEDEDTHGRRWDFDIMLDKKKLDRRRRRRRDGSIDLMADADDQIRELIDAMNEAANDDRTANIDRRPAVKKRKMLSLVKNALVKVDLFEAMLENGMVSAISEWLAPLPDKSLPALEIRCTFLKILERWPNLEQGILKQSGLGKAVMYLYKHPKETKENKLIAAKLIREWSRPIFQLDSDFRSLSKEERVQRDYSQMPLAKRKRLSVDEDNSGQIFSSKKLQKEKDDGPKRPGDPGFIMRARVPKLSTKDYVVRPQPQIESQFRGETKNKQASRFVRAQREFRQTNKTGLVKRAVGVSISGKNL
uniref:TFIIS N-terminal domain-containing protein n=1 Tax=Meloidogyne enterolobii TaxID=390850 RepID=A0A6V7W5X6_MELEN|nr:unnamed protein product [Meloidogyne enterolobii]